MISHVIFLNGIKMLLLEVRLVKDLVTPEVADMLKMIGMVLYLNIYIGSLN